MNFSRFKLFIREILKNNSIFYQNYLLNKSKFYSYFNEFKINNLGYEKIELTLDHKLFDNKINRAKHFSLLKNIDITKNGFHSVRFNRMKNDLPHEPKKRLETLKKLNILPNPNYFEFLNSYGIRGMIFDRLYNRKIRESYFLLPANIVYLEIISRIDFTNIDGYISDIGTGLGNFLGYLNFFIEKNKIKGIDNFSLISNDSVNYYQEKTFDFKVTNIFTQNDFLWILGGLPISFVINQINEYKPKYIMFESYYHKEFQLLNDYNIDFYNEIITVIKIKSYQSLKFHFK